MNESAFIERARECLSAEAFAAIRLPSVDPAAEILPMMSVARLRSLATDIEINGQRLPIIYRDGKLLDGRNRFIACAIAGKRPRIENHDNIPNPLAWVKSHNLERRDLDESQRSMVAARMVPLLRGEMHEATRTGKRAAIEAAQRTLQLVEAMVEEQPLTRPPGRAADLAAAEMSVSGSSVERANEVIKHGVPELVAKVDAGEIAVSAAAEVSRLPPERQREILRAADPRLVKEVAREQRKERAERRENDAYMSAGGFVRPLLSILEPGGQVETRTIIECCVGNGDLVEPLEVAGFEVVTNDVDGAVKANHHLDATKAETWAAFPPAEWVISNLPFNEAIRILPHALAHASIGVAVILRLSFLEPTTEGGHHGPPRADWLHSHPLTNQIVLPRYSFTGDGHTDSVTCAWMVWQRGKEPTIFIPLPDEHGMPGAALRSDSCLECNAMPGELHSDGCDDFGSMVPMPAR